MSGRKQHFIPQSLLKGFGFRKGKTTYVVAYTYDRGIFSPATEGIGAKRNFYSELSVEYENKTLDDAITSYEDSFATILSVLRGLGDGEPADGSMAAEFVTHLIIRGDHFRKSVSQAGTFLVDGLVSTVTEEDGAKALLGLSGNSPSALFEEQISKTYVENKSLFDTLDMSEDKFKSWSFDLIKTNFGRFHGEMLGNLVDLFSRISKQFPELAASSHRKSLGKGLVPEQRVKRMMEFFWYIVHSKVSLVLPDCVGVGFDGHGAVFPLAFSDIDTTVCIVLPIASDRLLIGTRSDQMPPVSEVNKAFASCAWDFFVAKDRTEAFEQLRTLLRTQAEKFLRGTVDDALNAAIERHSAPPSTGSP